MDQETVWDRDYAGPGTYTVWDRDYAGPGTRTVWDRLPDKIARWVRVIWASPRRKAVWQSVAKRVKW